MRQLPSSSQMSQTENRHHPHQQKVSGESRRPSSPAYNKAPQPASMAMSEKTKQGDGNFHPCTPQGSNPTLPHDVSGDRIGNADMYQHMAVMTPLTATSLLKWQQQRSCEESELSPLPTGDEVTLTKVLVGTTGELDPPCLSGRYEDSSPWGEPRLYLPPGNNKVTPSMPAPPPTGRV